MGSPQFQGATAVKRQLGIDFAGCLPLWGWLAVYVACVAVAACLIFTLASEAFGWGVALAITVAVCVYWAWLGWLGWTRYIRSADLREDGIVFRLGLNATELLVPWREVCHVEWIDRRRSFFRIWTGPTVYLDRPGKVFHRKQGFVRVRLSPGEHPHWLRRITFGTADPEGLLNDLRERIALATGLG
jgi:hypothetical protein